MGVITDMVKHFYNGRYKQVFEWVLIQTIQTPVYNDRYKSA